MFHKLGYVLENWCHGLGGKKARATYFEEIVTKKFGARITIYQTII